MISRELFVIQASYTRNFYKANKSRKICLATRACSSGLIFLECSFKFILKVGVEESIVNAPRVTDHGLAV
jgi:hypothetical protein